MVAIKAKISRGEETAEEQTKLVEMRNKVNEPPITEGRWHNEVVE